MAARSKAWVCGRSLAGIGLRDCGFESIRGRSCFSVLSVAYCASRDLCDGPISRAEESYWLCMCVSLSVIMCNKAYAEMVPKIPRCHYMLLT
jgi:hypothetical protein